MDDVSAEEIWRWVGQIAATYPLLECDKCAVAVMLWLERWGVEGTILRLRTKRRSEMFITSDRCGSDESITENGMHYGVEVIGRVFDNLSDQGLSREDWIRDFHCLSGRFILDEVPLAALVRDMEAE